MPDAAHDELLERIAHLEAENARLQEILRQVVVVAGVVGLGLPDVTTPTAPAAFPSAPAAAPRQPQWPAQASA